MGFLGQCPLGQFCYLKRNWAFLTLATVMACMMFFWDYILTFRIEVDLVWKSKWNWMKGLYLFQQYIPFTDIIWVVLKCESNLFPIFLCSFFPRSNGGYFGWDQVSEGILCWWRLVKLTCLTLTWNLFCVQHSRSLGLVHLRVNSMYTCLLKSYWLVSNSDPHTSDCME